ncbi:iron chelate uptake ABC transporter family permease subunit [Agrococcus sp. 1P02AA]|uniref:FecCD family ABC transporter permease n=1 Tax=Agrococcus sp. 1P02AA TaxID=3132259 RepID=UPI0039A6E642
MSGASMALWPSRVRMLRGPGIRVLLDVRALVVWAALLTAIGALSALALSFGDSAFTVGEVLAALVGQGDDTTVRVVQEWRLSRVVLALVGGASLAVSGAIFQSMTRNPLGSPDIIGFSTGAYTGALIVTLVLGASAASVSVGALIGGLATALAVYALAFKRGVQGFRLIVVGIAVSAVLSAINAYLLVRASLEQAVTAAIWGAGTLNEARWPEVLPVLVTLAVLTPACLLLARRLAVLELGDDHARMLGVRAEPTRIMLLIVGVGLVSIVTAITGPITFVALAAPQIAKRLVRGTGPALMASALVGALLLLASDVLAQRVIAPSQYPVGVITACLGGAYLVWLLSRGMKEQR